MAQKNIREKELSKVFRSSFKTIILFDYAQIKTFLQRKFPNKKVSQLPTKDILCNVIVNEIIQSIGNADLVLSEFKSKVINVIKSSPFLKMNYSKSNIELLDSILIKKLETYKILKDVTKINDNKNENAYRQKIVEIVVADENDIIKNKLKKQKENLKLLKDEWRSATKNFINEKGSQVITEIEEDNIIIETWWSELGLTMDPFNKEGLEDISKEQYDNILNNNPGIKFAKDFRSEIGDFKIGTNYLISGYFGTGKSATMDYMKEFSLDRDIISFTVYLIGKPTVMNLFNSFISNVVRIHIQRYLNGHGVITHLSPDEDGFWLGLLEINDIRKSKGFIFFIEDLHKQSLDIDQALGFLNLLQTLHAGCRQINIKVSFIVTGLPNWKNKILSDSRLTSVIGTNNIIELNTVSPSDATKAIKKRLNAFTNIKNKVVPHQLSSEFIQSLTEITKRTINHTGYRLYFDEIKRKLENREYNIFKLNPTNLSEDIMTAAIQIFETHKTVKDMLQKMMNTKIDNSGGFPTKTEKEAKIRFLSHMVLIQKLHDEDKFLTKQNNMLLLQNFAFSNSLISFDLSTKYWYINDIVNKLHIELNERVGIGLDTFILNYYLLNTKNSIYHKIRDGRVEEFSKYFRRYLSIIEKLDSSFCSRLIPLEEKFLNHVIKPHLKAKGYLKIDEKAIISTIGELLEIQLSIESKAFLKISSSIFSSWKNRYYNNDYIDNFIKTYIDNTEIKFNNDIKKEFLVDAVNTVKETIGEFSQTLDRLIKINREGLGAPLNEIQIQKIDQIFLIHLFKPNKIEIKFIVEDLEKIIRDYLLISSTLTFGTDYDRRRMWEESIGGMAKKRMIDSFNTTRAQYYDPNEFEQLQRNEFKCFINNCSKGIYYDEVSKPWINKYKSKEILTSYLNEFSSLNLKVSHNKKIEQDKYLKDSMANLYALTKQIVVITSLINEKILDSHIVFLDEGEYKIIFSHKIREKYKANIQNSFFAENKYSSNFKNDISKFRLKIWTPVVNNTNKDLLENELLFIEFGEFEKTANMFDQSANYGTAISNIILQYHLNKIDLYQIYGSTHFVKNLN
jgi:hypothetical protein